LVLVEACAWLPAVSCALLAMTDAVTVPDAVIPPTETL
jgi:hypothetical protein